MASARLVSVHALPSFSTSELADYLGVGVREVQKLRVASADERAVTAAQRQLAMRRT